MLKSGNNKTT